MSEPFIGEIRMFAGNFAPRGYAFCDGQLLAVNQNDALFSLFGTLYGGDGRTTFGLPDLRGRVPVHQGQGPGLSQRRIGQRGGSERVTLTNAQLPAHSHGHDASARPASRSTPAGNVLAEAEIDVYGQGGTRITTNQTESIGGGQAHDNVMPFRCIHFIVALVGIYPSRS